MEILRDLFIKEFQQILYYTPKLLIALFVLITAVWLGRRAGKAVVFLLAKSSLSKVHKSFFLNAITWLFIIFGLIIGLNILGLEKVAASLLAGGGITAVVLGFAFREIGENFLAGFFLAFSRPFNIGDTIKSADFMGVVKAVELRSTHIRTADGRDIFIPSSQIFNQPLVNYTKDGLRRPSFVVGIDYGDDAMVAVKLLLDVTKDVEGVLADPPPGVYIAEFSAQYVQLEVFFWLDVFKKGSSFLQIKSDVMDRCLKALIQKGYTLSSETTSNLALASKIPIDIAIQERA
ncbi:MAG: mechanosensitive ion channel family protein [Desulfobulbales bacterium]|nr:mechanosensitive ion channel family protein [Desulfobulbales bacterium]